MLSIDQLQVVYTNHYFVLDAVNVSAVPKYMCPNAKYPSAYLKPLLALLAVFFCRAIEQFLR